MDQECPQNTDEAPVMKYAAMDKVGRSSLTRPQRSLLERAFLVMFFLSIGGSLIFVFKFRLPPADRYSIQNLVKQLVSDRGALAGQIELFRQSTGTYPSVLGDLTTRPADPVIAAKWGDEPYIRDPGSLVDAWGNPLLYRMPGVHNPTKFDLWSMGPDGVSGTADDIGNW